MLVLKIIDNAEKSTSSFSWYYSYLHYFRQDVKQKFGENKHWLEEITEGENTDATLFKTALKVELFSCFDGRPTTLARKKIIAFKMNE